MQHWRNWNSKHGKILVFSHCGTIFWTLFDGEPAGVVSVVFNRAPAAKLLPWAYHLLATKMCSCVKTDWNFLWAKNWHIAIYIFINEEVFHPLTYATLLYYNYSSLFCIDSIGLWYCLKKKYYPVFELQSHSDSFSTDNLSVISFSSCLHKRNKEILNSHEMNNFPLFFYCFWNGFIFLFTYGTRSRELARGIKALLLVNIVALCITVTHKGTKYC